MGTENILLKFERDLDFTVIGSLKIQRNKRGTQLFDEYKYIYVYSFSNLYCYMLINTLF